MLFSGDDGMTDFLEIMNICAYDIKKASEIVEEMLRECGLERIEQEGSNVYTVQSESSAK